MANAKRCDLCGGFYAVDENNIDLICITNCHIDKRYDLISSDRKRKLPNRGLGMDICPNCAAAFKALYLSRKELGSK